MATELDLADARGRMDALLDQVLAGGEPVALTRDGRRVLVVLSWEDYDFLVGVLQQRTEEWGLPQAPGPTPEAPPWS